ncbi:MAG: hypothetical protein CBC19_03365 [Oceanospirillales bacterium TMED59]|nr:MAG: hypothetical protein CBC19_03365 [Oceanospirillales bacterium TMED59]
MSGRLSGELIRSAWYCRTGQPDLRIMKGFGPAGIQDVKPQRHVKVNEWQRCLVKLETFGFMDRAWPKICLQGIVVLSMTAAARRRRPGDKPTEPRFS